MALLSRNDSWSIIDNYRYDSYDSWQSLLRYRNCSPAGWDPKICSYQIPKASSLGPLISGRLTKDIRFANFLVPHGPLGNHCPSAIARTKPHRSIQDKAHHCEASHRKHRRSSRHSLFSAYSIWTRNSLECVQNKHENHEF